MVEQKKAIDGMLDVCQKLEEVDLFLQKQVAFQEPLDHLNLVDESNVCSGQEQNLRSLVWWWRRWGKLGRRCRSVVSSSQPVHKTLVKCV